MTTQDDKGRLEALARMISTHLGQQLPRPKLRLVKRDDLAVIVAPDDPITRDSKLSRIRDLAKMYWLGWLVRQEGGVGGPESLMPDDLTALLEKMERARECRVEGIAFDEAGLVRDTSATQFRYEGGGF